MSDIIAGNHNGWRFTVVENKYDRMLKVQLSYRMTQEYIASDLTVAINDAKALIDRLNRNLDKNAENKKR